MVGIPVFAQNLELCKFSFAQREKMSSFHGRDPGFCSKFGAVQILICTTRKNEQFSWSGSRFL